MSEILETNQIEKLDVSGVIALLDVLSHQEFKEFVLQNQIDGRKFLSLTENTLALWNHKCNASKLTSLIDNLRKHPDKYKSHIDTVRLIKVSNIAVHEQYQTVTSIRRVKDRISSIDDIMRNIVPEKSFLYRNKQHTLSLTSYTPMSASPKKPRKFYRFSSFDYPIFNMRSKSKIDDRGYYSIKANKTDSKAKYKSISNAADLQNEISDDHLYEDLSSTDDTVTTKNDSNITNTNRDSSNGIIKPSVQKIQELFQSFKLPFLKKAEELKVESVKDEQQASVDVKAPVVVSDENSVHLYENNDISDIMYDDVHTKPVAQDILKTTQKIPVEEYLVPRAAEVEYSSVMDRQESLLSYILSLLGSFGMRRESNDTISEDFNTANNKHEEPEIRKWNDERKSRGGKMADRPLPVPVENEAYYMAVDRIEAKNILMGQPDGTFILRPSSQPNHVYTLSVSCARAVHNVGVRRRSDGRLALGYARRGERSFGSVGALLRHHARQRLLLVAAGGVLGATTLGGPPVYYQTPSSLPVHERVAVTLA